MSALQTKKSDSLFGTVIPPGDKSISHRCIIMASLANGSSNFKNLLCGHDVLASAEIFRKLGANIEIDITSKTANIHSSGLLETPNDILDCQNSGTAARLILGVLASHPIKSVLKGDKSMSSRPMSRVIRPLEEMGANISAREGGLLPITVQGYDDLVPINYTMPIASAQVKSAILLAAVNIRGVTKITEPIISRDHSEKLMPLFGVKLELEKAKNGERIILCEGQHSLNGIDYSIPGDISSSAFIIAATLMTKNSQVTIKDVGLNPTRTGFLDAIKSMGADITVIEAENPNMTEKRGDIIIKSSTLHGAVIEGYTARMIDEYPILSILASTAKGETTFKDVGELRFKESDRLSVMEKGLQACGIECSTGKDWMKITGQINSAKGGVTISADNDHRIAMSFLTLGLSTKMPITVTGTDTISTSYPSFFKDFISIGAEISQVSDSNNKAKGTS